MGKDVVIWVVAIIILVAIGGIWGRNLLKSNPIGGSQIFSINNTVNGAQVLTEPPDEKGVVIKEILREPKVYEGLTVTLRGRIQDWVTKRAFTLPNVSSGSGEVLVIVPNDLPSPESVSEDQLALGDNTLVEVRGEVKILSQGEIERILGVSFDDPNLSQFNFDDQPTIIATSAKELK